MARDKFYGGKRAETPEALAEAQAYVDRVRAQREAAAKPVEAPITAKPKKSTKPGG